MNGKTEKIRTNTKIVREKEETENFKNPLCMEALDNAIKTMKCKKAARVDGLMTEQIKQFGHKTREWIIELFNNCIQNETISTIWLKTKVIALLKPAKNQKTAKNFRPALLLCHLYKLIERMILNRIKPEIDKKLINEQAGFRPRKLCTGQVLNLVHHIEEGYEAKYTTGVAYIDLTAAYDTVNQKLFLKKLY